MSPSGDSPLGSLTCAARTVLAEVGKFGWPTHRALGNLDTPHKNGCIAGLPIRPTLIEGFGSKVSPWPSKPRRIPEVNSFDPLIYSDERMLLGEASLDIEISIKNKIPSG
jgi:hypothetical protein